MKVLKRHSRLAVTLAPKAMPRSMVADDIVGMTVAGLAMGAALVTIWLAQRNTPYGVLYLAIYVAGYILKVLLAAWPAVLTKSCPLTRALFSQCSVKHGGGHMPWGCCVA